jgi:arginine decarboxylase-like protein
MGLVYKLSDGYEVRKNSSRVINVIRVEIESLGLNIGRMTAWGGLNCDETANRQKNYDDVNHQFTIFENKLYDVLSKASNVEVTQECSIWIRIKCDMFDLHLENWQK